MTEIVTDELLLTIAKEELNKYADGYSEEGLILGNYNMDCIGAVYKLLCRIYDEQYLETQGIKLERFDDLLITKIKSLKKDLSTLRKASIKNVEDFERLMEENKELKNENEQLKQQIKDLRLGVLDSIHEAEEIQCSCNPCVVEEIRKGGGMVE